MKKLLLVALSVTFLASCGGKNSSSSNGQTTDSTGVENGAVVEDGSFSYILDENVIEKVVKLLGENVLVDYEAQSVELEAGEVSAVGQNEDGSYCDVLDARWASFNGDVYMGYYIVCLKRTDGKYAVIHQNMTTLDGFSSVYMTDFYLLDGDKLVQTESFLPELSAADIVDEYDNWMFDWVSGGAPAEFESYSPDTYMYNVRRNANNSCNVAVTIMNYGGKWLKWDGEKLEKSDELYTRSYVFGNSLASFEFDAPVPEIPEMKHYALDNDGNGNVMLKKDGTPVLKMLYKEDALVEITALTKEFSEVAPKTYKSNELLGE